MKKKDLKKAALDPLDTEIELMSFPQYSLVMENDSLKVYEIGRLFGCIGLAILVGSALLYFIDPFYIVVFFFNLLVALFRLLWNYKYSFQKKPVIIIDKKGITHKNDLYAWEYIENMVCGEEYDGERAVYTATHVKFNYKGKIEKIYIGGYSQDSEEIIHYISSFQRSYHDFSAGISIDPTLS